MDPIEEANVRVEVIAQRVEHMITALVARMDALEQRIAALEGLQVSEDSRYLEH